MITNDGALEELKQRGEGVPAPESVAQLYRQAFDEFGARAVEQQAGRAPDHRLGAQHHRELGSRGKS